jgi:hypothetical protein
MPVVASPTRRPTMRLEVSSTTPGGRSDGPRRGATHAIAAESCCSRPRRISDRPLTSVPTKASSRSPRSRAGEAWRSTQQRPFRLKTVGTWSPSGQEGSRPVGGPYHPLANFCSAHYFDVDGSTVTYAWYGEGTRFLDISDPANPTQFAYWRPDDGIVWASYLHKGYVYTADRTRGVDVLRLTAGASAARSARRDIALAAPSARQRRFLARVATRFRPDPGTSFLCFIQTG